MDLAPSAETIDPAKLCTSKTTPLSKLPRYGGYSSASRLTRSVFVNLEKVVEATGIFPWLLWRLQQWGVGPVVFLPVFIIYADKTSLMTKFKCITFRLFPVFLPTDVSLDNSPHMHALSVPMI